MAACMRMGHVSLTYMLFATLPLRKQLRRRWYHCRLVSLSLGLNTTETKRTHLSCPNKGHMYAPTNLMIQSASETASFTTTARQSLNEGVLTGAFGEFDAPSAMDGLCERGDVFW